MTTMIEIHAKSFVDSTTPAYRSAKKLGYKVETFRGDSPRRYFTVPLSDHETIDRIFETYRADVERVLGKKVVGPTVVARFDDGTLPQVLYRVGNAAAIERVLFGTGEAK